MGVFVIKVAAQEVQDTIFGKYKHKWENENSGEIDGKDLCTCWVVWIWDFIQEPCAPFSLHTAHQGLDTSWGEGGPCSRQQEATKDASF